MDRGHRRPVIQWPPIEARKDINNYKTYPIPYVADSRMISVTNTQREHECQTDKLCGHCGETLDEIKYWFGHVVELRSQHMDCLFFHEKCAKISAKLCPHLDESMMRNNINREIPQCFNSNTVCTEPYSE